jgi:hypothetical protein
LKEIDLTALIQAAHPAAEIRGIDSALNVVFVRE